MYRKFTELYGVDYKEIKKRQSDLVKGDIAHWAVHLDPILGEGEAVRPGSAIVPFESDSGFL